MKQAKGAWAYLDGAFVPQEEARVRGDDGGLLFGRGVYETFRAREGSVFRLDRHVLRLEAGARALGIPVPDAIAQLPAIVRGLADRCRLQDARVRLTLTAGPPGGTPSLLLQARAAADYPAALYERGMTAVTATVRRNETSALTGVKSLNCLDNVMSRELARAAGADTAILLNTRGSIAEASTANIFAVRGKTAVTPPLRDGPLPGVTRGAILDLAPGAGVRAEERPLSVSDLLGADEAFLTGAVMGVMALVSLDGRAIGDGRPGEVTQQLQEMYETAVTGERNPESDKSGARHR